MTSAAQVMGGKKPGLEVSVPCDHCGKPIRFGFEYCNGCGTRISKDLANALEERLDAASSEFRDMRKTMREVSALFLVLGALRIVLSGFIYASIVNSSDGAPLGAAQLGLAFDVLIGGAMIAGAWFVTKRPDATLWVFLGWLFVQLLIFLLSPSMFFAGIIGRILLTIGLLRTVTASRRIGELRRELVSATP